MREGVTCACGAGALSAAEGSGGSHQQRHRAGGGRGCSGRGRESGREGFRVQVSGSGSEVGVDEQPLKKTRGGPRSRSSLAASSTDTTLGSSSGPSLLTMPTMPPRPSMRARSSDLLAPTAVSSLASGPELNPGPISRSAQPKASTLNPNKVRQRSQPPLVPRFPPRSLQPGAVKACTPTDSKSEKRTTMLRLISIVSRSSNGSGVDQVSS
jgi:hypothetical protein